MISKPTFSFVLPCYNKVEITYGYCQRALASIYEHTKEPFEVIVVDNRSPEHENMTTQQLRDELWGQATVIQVPQNIGFGAACNLGFRLAQGDYLVCMNTDAELVEDSASMLRDAMKLHNLVVGFPESWDNCQHYGLGKDDRVMHEWFFGAFWVGDRRIIVDEMGGFDPYYEMCYFEDTDLWSRLFKAGYQLAGWRGTWVKHKGNASALPEINDLLLANRERYFKRWGVYTVVKSHQPQSLAVTA